MPNTTDTERVTERVVMERAINDYWLKHVYDKDDLRTVEEVIADFALSQLTAERQRVAAGIAKVEAEYGRIGHGLVTEALDALKAEIAGETKL